MNPITLPVAELKSAMVGLSKILNRHSSLPVLQMIHIERTKDGWLCLTATDLDRFVTVRLEQPSTGDPLVLLVSLEELQKVAKICGKSEHLQLVPFSNRLVTVRFDVAGQPGEQNLSSLPVDEYPPIPKVRGKAIPINDQLRDSLHEAMACCSSDTSRPLLLGAFIDTHKNSAHYIVGTDGRHLYSSNSFQLPLKASIIIPRHKFLEWREFNADGEWQLKVDENPPPDMPPWVQISSRRWRLITKQPGGNYPAWKQVIPDSKLTRCILELDPLKLEEVLRIIERLPCHDEKFRTIGLSWRDNRLSLMAKEKILGEWLSLPVPVLKGEGVNLVVFCNRTLLVKALQFGLNTIHLIDKVSPLKFSSSGKQMIVMPIREEAADPPKDRDKREPISPPKPLQSKSPWPRAPEVEVPTPPPVMQNTPPPLRSTTDPYDEVQQQLHALRDSLRGSLNAVTALSAILKQCRADQRHTSRDLHSLRNTLRHLQKVPL